MFSSLPPRPPLHYAADARDGQDIAQHVMSFPQRISIVTALRLQPAGIYCLLRRPDRVSDTVAGRPEACFLVFPLRQQDNAQADR